MAIAFSVLTEGGEDTDNTTFTTASVSPAAGSIVLITVMNFENSSTQPSIGSISGCGLTWTLVREQAVDNAGSDRATAHIWVGTGTPSSGTITVDWTGATTVRRPSWIVTEVTGADTANPIVQATGTTGASSGTSGNVSFASAFADSVNNATFALYGVQNNSGTDFTTVDANLTKLAWEAVSYSHQTIAYKIGEEANVDGSWSSGRWGIAICEIAAASGSTPNEGTASGGYAFSGTASGSRASEGSSSGGYSFAGSAAGETVHKGTASGSYSFSGTAAGNAPANSGTASGTYDFAGTAAGEANLQGSASGGYTFSGTAAGSTTRSGTASGGYTFSGTAEGNAPDASEGTAAGGYDFSGSASGTSPNGGGAEGDYEFAGAAAGAAAYQGSTVGSYAFAGSAVGEHTTYEFTPPTYQRPYIQLSPALSRGKRYHLDQGISIVRIGGVLRSMRSPSPTQLEAAGTEGEDWFIGGHIYRITAETRAELQTGGFA